MSKNRILFDADIVLKNEFIGFGTDNPLDRLHVAGTTKGIDFKLDGDSTFTSYGGFVYENHLIDLDFTLEFEGELVDLSTNVVVSEDKVLDIPVSSTLNVSTLDSLTIENHLGVPVGGTIDRSENPIEGTVRFNADLNTLEFYNGVEWRQFTVTGASGRGVFASGNGAPLAATFLNNIEFINIPSGGNASNFGDITQSRQGPGGCSSSTRGLFGGGYNGPAGGLFNIIDYITIPSEGNAIDFGDLTISVSNRSACASSTRGVWGGGANPTNVIEYVEIQTLGNSIDFGDLSLDRQQPGGISSPTRGIFAGGIQNPLAQSLIDFITISSKGNAIKFGDLTQIRFAPTGCSNSVRGLFGGGYIPAGAISLDTIDYITITSEGNAIDFGNLTLARNWGGGVSTKTRGVFMSGRNTPTTRTNVIDFVNIASTGNAQDFGDLSIGRQGGGACSDSHGGLGGF